MRDATQDPGGSPSARCPMRLGEFVLILFLVVLSCVVVISVYGKKIRARFEALVSTENASSVQNS